MLVLCNVFIMFSYRFWAYVHFIVFCQFLLIYKEDRHVALTARSAVNATWRRDTGDGAQPAAVDEKDPDAVAVGRRVADLERKLSTHQRDVDRLSNDNTRLGEATQGHPWIG